METILNYSNFLYGTKNTFTENSIWLSRRHWLSNPLLNLKFSELSENSWIFGKCSTVPKYSSHYKPWSHPNTQIKPLIYTSVLLFTVSWLDNKDNCISKNSNLFLIQYPRFLRTHNFFLQKQIIILANFRKYVFFLTIG